MCMEFPCKTDIINSCMWTIHKMAVLNVKGVVCAGRQLAMCLLYV